MIQKIRDWLKGKKVYMVAVGGLLAVLIGWSDGAINTPTALEKLWDIALVASGRAAVQKVENAVKS